MLLKKILVFVVLSFNSFSYALLKYCYYYNFKKIYIIYKYIKNTMIFINSFFEIFDSITVLMFLSSKNQYLYIEKVN